MMNSFATVPSTASTVLVAAIPFAPQSSGHALDFVRGQRKMQECCSCHLFAASSSGDVTSSTPKCVQVLNRRRPISSGHDGQPTALDF